MMRTVRVEDAVGMVLGHDLTKIVPGEFKGAAFKKGHVIKQEDIKELKRMGKNHINIIELQEGQIHEDEAALRTARALAGNGVSLKGPSEGKVELKAMFRGIVKMNVAALNHINEIEEVAVATIHSNTLVEEGQSLAATRIIPLSILEEKILQLEEIGEACDHRIISVYQLKPMKIGLIVTGTEVYEGRIQDSFAPVMKEKIKHYGCSLLDLQYCPDDLIMIEHAIAQMIEKGADIVLACGGMSVDADDVTPSAIKNVSEEVVSYGVPMIPGNMLMLAYKGNTAILGIPGAAIFLKNTSLDILLPRILCGERLIRKDLTAYGHGGLCLGCKTCIYPMCPYGK
jgi:molybdenum cofactor synthesis domain-containing protein